LFLSDTISKRNPTEATFFQELWQKSLDEILEVE